MRIRLFLLVVLLAVTNAVAAQVTCPTGVNHCAQASWSAVPTPGGAPTGYNIYRSTTSGGCATLTATTCTKLGSTVAPTVSFLDSPLAANTTYYYVITATNKVGESAGSPQVSGTTSDDLPGAPGSIVLQIK